MWVEFLWLNSFIGSIELYEVYVVRIVVILWKYHRNFKILRYLDKWSIQIREWLLKLSLTQTINRIGQLFWKGIKNWRNYVIARTQSKNVYRPAI